MIRPLFILFGLLLVTAPVIAFLAAFLYTVGASLLDDYRREDWFAFWVGLSISSAMVGVTLLVASRYLPII